jgi:hypothetical protein
MGIGITAGIAAILVIGGTALFYWRRKRRAREEEELDRLYGMGKLNSDGLTRADEFPGFYRGQRPTADTSRSYGSSYDSRNF